MYFCLVFFIFLLPFSSHSQKFFICKQIKLSNNNFDDVKKQCIGQTLFIEETEKQRENPKENGKPGVQCLKGDKGESGSMNETKIQAIVDKNFQNYINSTKNASTISQSKYKKKLKTYNLSKKNYTINKIINVIQVLYV